MNDIPLDSFFSETILDNNNIPVTDINAGLNNLFKTFNEEEDVFNAVEYVFISDILENYPDLIAYKSNLKDEQYWWWISLTNHLENPILDFKKNWIYPMPSTAQIQTFINLSNASENNSSNPRIGKIVDLN